MVAAGPWKTISAALAPNTVTTVANPVGDPVRDLVTGRIDFLFDAGVFAASQIIPLMAPHFQQVNEF